MCIDGPSPVSDSGSVRRMSLPSISRAGASEGIGVVGVKPTPNLPFRASKSRDAGRPLGVGYDRSHGDRDAAMANGFCKTPGRRARTAPDDEMAGMPIASHVRAIGTLWNLGPRLPECGSPEIARQAASVLRSWPCPASRASVRQCRTQCRSEGPGESEKMLRRLPRERRLQSGSWRGSATAVCSRAVKRGSRPRGTVCLRRSRARVDPVNASWRRAVNSQSPAGRGGCRTETVATPPGKG
jgi:hypothetical protein